MMGAGGGAESRWQEDEGMAPPVMVSAAGCARLALIISSPVSRAFCSCTLVPLRSIR